MGRPFGAGPEEGANPAVAAPAAAATRFLFGKERRIRKRAEFLRVQQTGLRATSKHFVLLIAAGVSPSAPSRLGIVATKKVGDATQRNRIKRLCRECFRLWPGFLPDGVDLVVIAREGADALTLDKVRSEWERAHTAVLGNCKKVLAAGFVPAPKPDRAAAAGSPAPKREGAPRREAAPKREGAPRRDAAPGRASGSRVRGAKRSEK